MLGVIREEITDRQQVLPSANGRIAAWLMPATLSQDVTHDLTATTANTSYRRRHRQQDDSLFTSDTSASEMTDIASQDSRDDDDRYYAFGVKRELGRRVVLSLDSHPSRKQQIRAVPIIDGGDDNGATDIIRDGNE